MKIKTRYVVMGLEKHHPVKVGGYSVELELTWADRMCGVMAIFETKKAAKEYAGKRFEIMGIKVEL